MRVIWVALLATACLLLSSCGGSSSHQADSLGSAEGNWQFRLTAPTDNPTGALYGLQGGFLLQSQANLSGSANYSVSTGDGSIACNSGSAKITGNMSGQKVTLTAVAGSQTFQLDGTVSQDGKTIVGTYSATAGKAADASACGSKQTGMAWQATRVPSLTGAVQGNFHVVSGGLLSNQNFNVTGSLNQGDNIGASSATVTGTLSFENFPCLPSDQLMQVNGTISGDSVFLNLFNSTGTQIGQMGTPQNPVTYSTSSSGSNILRGTKGYSLNKGCLQVGNICLGVGDAKACTQPLSLSPGTITFPAQVIGSAPTSQTITITNTDPSGSTLDGLTLTWAPLVGYTSPYNTPSDFNKLPNYTQQNTCIKSGSAFSLASNQSCTVTVTFAPQQSCTWIPSIVGPSQCPPYTKGSVPTPPGLSATLAVKLRSDEVDPLDGDGSYSVLINGVAGSALVPSTPELDFGSVAVSESSAPQELSFVNQGSLPVHILPKASSRCLNPDAGLLNFPNPVHSGDVDGIRLIQQVIPFSLDNGNDSIQYLCDSDLQTTLPNFQLSEDHCTGEIIAPGGSCNLKVTYVPQPGTAVLQGLDYFLQLTSNQCVAGSSVPYCEIDSGRMPVEVKANPASPLRMTPAAGLDFPTQAKGTASFPLTITLFNDPKDPNAATVNFKGRLMAGDFTETDNCGASLDPGKSCDVSIVFVPTTKAYEQGSFTITYIGRPEIGAQSQVIRMRGFGQ